MMLDLIVECIVFEGHHETIPVRTRRDLIKVGFWFAFTAQARLELALEITMVIL
jgi:hypothetical protein